MRFAYVTVHSSFSFIRIVVVVVAGVGGGSDSFRSFANILSLSIALFFRFPLSFHALCSLYTEFSFVFMRI